MKNQFWNKSNALLGKMVKNFMVIGHLVSPLAHCQHQVFFLHLNDGPKVPEGH